MAEREHDLVLFGATGFTGGLTADYLAANAPPQLRWALAGRSAGKLEQVRSRLADAGAAADLPLLHADVDQPDSLAEVARSARVVVTTVGPYIRYGEPLVAACAAAGSGYLDLTGEPEFVDLMYLRHHAAAEESGARLVHCAGFDSIPHDLGALFTVQQLPEDVPLTLAGYVSARGTFSGGTFDSALTAFSRLRQTRRAAADRRRAEPRPRDRRVRALPGKPHHAPEMGGWALPMPTIDPQVVARSARALERYGPDFSYSHYMATGLAPALGIAAGAGTLMAAAQVPPLREWLLRRRPSGAGPTAEQRARGWFRVRFRGEGGGRRVVCEVTGGDPGYGDTAKMLGEAGLCMALDELPETRGQVTTAVALGEPLIERLRRAGIGFAVVEGPEPG